MGRGCRRVVCSDAARQGRTDGGGPREIRFARREVQVPRWFVIAPSWAPQAFAQPSLSLFVCYKLIFHTYLGHAAFQRHTRATAHTAKGQ